MDIRNAKIWLAGLWDSLHCKNLVLSDPCPAFDLSGNVVDANVAARRLARLLARRPAGVAQGVSVDAELSAGKIPYSRTRAYRLYMPANYDPSRPVALVVVLHGCHQTHEDIQRITGFDVLADREQFLVLYPYVTSYLGYRARNCWGWWIRAHRTRGRGEVEDIWRIIEQVCQDYRVDASRLYVCGLSSGGAMAVNCLVAHADKFAGGASVAGLAYGESPSAVKASSYASPRYHSLARLCLLMRVTLSGMAPPNLLIVHSDGDDLVSVAATDSLEQSWRQVAGIEADQPDWYFKGETAGVPWTLQGYTSHGEQRLIRMHVSGLPHAWLGGPEGPHSSPDAPAISQLIWWHLNASSNRLSGEKQRLPEVPLQEAS